MTRDGWWVVDVELSFCPPATASCRNIFSHLILTCGYYAVVIKMSRIKWGSAEWCDEWMRANVINQSCSSSRFQLRHLWANPNRFRTGQGQCTANLVHWCKTPDPSCSCGAAKQWVILLTTALCQDFLVVLILYISLVMRQSSGWAYSANDKKKIRWTL